MATFTRCKHEDHAGEADLATDALEHWAALGWHPIDTTAPAPKRGRKSPADDEQQQ